MPRPRKSRRIESSVREQCFRPCRTGRAAKNAVKLFLDELEAVRLSDLEGLSQEDAAAKMEISRSTFARLLNEAHSKIAEAIIQSKPIMTEGAEQDENLLSGRKFKCAGCGHEWELMCGTGCPASCPECGGGDFRRTNCGLRYQRRGTCGKGQNTGGKHGCCRQRKPNTGFNKKGLEEAENE